MLTAKYHQTLINTVIASLGFLVEKLRPVKDVEI